MQAILKFDLPDDKNDFDIASHAMDWALTVYNMDCWLREQVEYHGQDYDEIRQMLWDILGSRNLNLDMII